MSRAVYYDMSGNEVYDDVPTRAQEELEYIENNKTKHEAINHPDYYKGNGIEAIDVIEAWNLDFCLGNTVKYIARRGIFCSFCSPLFRSPAVPRELPPRRRGGFASKVSQVPFLLFILVLTKIQTPSFKTNRVALLLFRLFEQALFGTQSLL